MREKEPQLVVTFYTTAEAMATERLCRQLGLPGRLISVPRELTADCGIAWAAPVSGKAALRAALAEHGIETADFYELLR